MFILVGRLVRGGVMMKEIFFGEVCEVYDNGWVGVRAVVGRLVSCLLRGVEDQVLDQKPFFFQSM